MEDSRLIQVDDPWAHQRLAVLRDPATQAPAFRSAAADVSTSVLRRSASQLMSDSSVLDTGLGTLVVPAPPRRVAVVPVLRAGLAMLAPALEVFDAASVVPVWASRDEETLEATLHTMIPTLAENTSVVVCDPMVATGGSAVAVIDALLAAGAARVSVVCWLCAPVGAEKVLATHPSTSLVCAAVDEGLNDQGFIVPGLGDAGDRWCAQLRPW